MLKIKDNVDLKELEKFGFREYTGNDWAMFIKDDCVELLIEDGAIGINITSGFEWDVVQELGILFDLIQAGLVEKV